GELGHGGHIHDADVAGAHGRGDGGFLDPLEHALIERGGGIDFALEDVVLDGFLGFGGDQGGLGGVDGGKQLFAALRLLIVVVDAVYDGFALAHQGGLQGDDLGLHFLDLGVLGAIGGAEVGFLAAEVGELGLVVAQGIIVEDIGQGLGLGALGFGEFLLQLAEFLIGDVLLFLVAREEEAGLAGIALELIFGALQLDAHVFQLARQPLAGALVHLPAGFHTLIDVFVAEGVDKVGGEAGVGGIAQDFNDAGLSGGAQLEAGGGEGERLLAGIDGLGLGEVEGVTPGEDAAGGRGGIARLGLGEFGGDPVQERIAL